jgi:hypothetical protein
MTSSTERIQPEEFPDGPYGAAHNQKLGKSTPWEPGQQIHSAFTYEMREFHEGLERDYPGSHPRRDEPEEPAQS